MSKLFKRAKNNNFINEDAIYDKLRIILKNWGNFHLLQPRLKKILTYGYCLDKNNGVFLSKGEIAKKMKMDKSSILTLEKIALQTLNGNPPVKKKEEMSPMFRGSINSNFFNEEEIYEKLRLILKNWDKFQLLSPRLQKILEYKYDLMVVNGRFLSRKEIGIKMKMHKCSTSRLERKALDILSGIRPNKDRYKIKTEDDTVED